MKKSRLHACEIKRHREVTPPLCAVCRRVGKCRAFRIWYQSHRDEYLDFVLDVCKRFPDKYTMEVDFMAEKQTFVQIVDMATGAIERIVNLKEIVAMTPEEKLELSRNKNLFVVTHRLEPIVRVELKKSVITEPLQFAENTAAKAAPEAAENVEPAPPAASKTRKKK
ncbi:MAG TPA: hypothetical protein PLU06_00525 [Candidatus Syntrophosphaera sp.]|nr:hypothetical protein [Candidatus Cloacimonadota bacterium]HPB43222.1 hypothetical protein [Candidatus Syntrophosphaera sp.]HQO67264.1 hypothetical protein [Candidatus Syntrophosphaera sp.]